MLPCGKEGAPDDFWRLRLVFLKKELPHRHEIPFHTNRNSLASSRPRSAQQVQNGGYQAQGQPGRPVIGLAVLRTPILVLAHAVLPRLVVTAVDALLRLLTLPFVITVHIVLPVCTILLTCLKRTIV